MNTPDARVMTAPKQTDDLLVVSFDTALRQDLAADCLGLTLSPQTLAWQADRRQEFLTLLEDPYGDSLAVMDARETRDGLCAAVAGFRATAAQEGRTPFVISLDPAFLPNDAADYTFQETRVSIVGPDQPIISIEQNPRGHANRFTRQDGPHNGAGKPLQVQMDEIRAMLDCYEGPVDVALVEDFVNTGRGIAERFGGLMDDPAIQTTIITGLVNDRARQLLEGRAAIAATTTTEPGTNVHHMDVSDLLPTLGGRVVGWSRRTPAGPTAPVLRAVGGIARQVPMAVDAICGNYPWQADIYRRDTDSAFMRRLGSFCATSALEFWESLEQAADRELTWDVLHRLTGTLRIFYPVKDLAAHHLPAHMIQPSPRRAVEAIIQEAAHA